MLTTACAAGAVSGAIVAMGMLHALGMEMIVVMGMGMVMLVGMAVGMGMGHAVVGVLVGVGMFMVMGMTTDMIMMQMHFRFSFVFFLYYKRRPYSCQTNKYAGGSGGCPLSGFTYLASAQKTQLHQRHWWPQWSP
jgi:hypothetical protein